MLLKSEEMNRLYENKVKEATQRSYVVIPPIFKARKSLLITSIKTIYRLKELFSKKLRQNQSVFFNEFEEIQ